MVIKKNEETKIELFIENNSKKYTIPKGALKALNNFGIFDARVLSVLTETEIAAIPDISEKTALALVRAADDNFRGPLFQKAADQSERLLLKRKYFTSGSKNLDVLLGGGIPTSAIVEINGEYRSGKTQTCLTCCVTAQLPEDKGGLGRPVIYFDTENSFQAQHLREIGKRFGINEEQLLDNLFVVQAEQLRYLNQAIDRLPGYVQALDPGLIVIDSLMAPFRSEFHELNLLAVRQKKIGKLIGLLKRIAIAFNTSVIFTNQVMANIGSMSAQFNPTIATGGHVVAHASDIRIQMKKLKDTLRRAKIEDCAWLPSATSEFYVTSKGISDIPEITPKATDEQSNKQTDSSPLKDGIDEVAKTKKSRVKEVVKEEGSEEEQLPEEQIEEADFIDKGDVITESHLTEYSEEETSPDLKTAIEEIIEKNDPDTISQKVKTTMPPEKKSKIPA